MQLDDIREHLEQYNHAFAQAESARLLLEELEAGPRLFLSAADTYRSVRLDYSVARRLLESERDHWLSVAADIKAKLEGLS